MTGSKGEGALRGPLSAAALAVLFTGLLMGTASAIGASMPPSHAVGGTVEIGPLPTITLTPSPAPTETIYVDVPVPGPTVTETVPGPTVTVTETAAPA